MNKMEEQLWHKHKWPERVKKSIKPYPTEPLYKVLENPEKLRNTLSQVRVHYELSKIQIRNFTKWVDELGQFGDV